MSKQRCLFFLVFLAIILVGNGCCPPNCPPSEPLQTCPPVGSYKKATISGESSSIEVYTNTIAKTDNGLYWCNPDYLLIKVADLTGAPQCPITTGCLKAVDVQPTNLDFSATTVLADRPLLTFDLTAHNTPPKDTCNSYCYTIYQLTPANTWRNVGPANRDSVTNLATGNINHFSVFAIAELPPPTPVPSPGNLSLQVASQFTYSLDGSMIDAAFAVRDNDLGLTLEEHIIRLVDIDPKFTVYDPNVIPPECMGIGLLDQWLTCVFPIDTIVTVTIDNQNVPIDNYLRFTITHDAAGFNVELIVRQIFAY